MAEFLMWLLQSALTVAAVVLAIGVLAGLFMVVFSLATGIDKNIQQ